MQDLLGDVRLGARSLAKDAAFTVVALLTLALGTGANAAVFSLAKALLMAPLDVPEPHRVVRVRGLMPGQPFDVMSHANFADVREQGQSFAALAAHQQTDVTWGSSPEAPDAQVELVTGDYFRVMGRPAALGRVLDLNDDRVGAAPAIVVSDAAWRRLLGSDPAAVGRTVELNGAPYTIVGVMGPGFAGAYPASPVDAWAPLLVSYAQLRPRATTIDQRGWGWLRVTGRLRPGTSTVQADDELARIAASLRREHPQHNEGFDLRTMDVGALPDGMRGGAARALAFLQIAALLVLIVACANVAGAQLARAVKRRRDTALRVAIGASPRRVMRLWIVESLLLAVCASAAGLLVASWARDAMLAAAAGVLGPAFRPAVPIDGAVLAFAVGLGALSGVVAALAPARRAASVDPATILKDESVSIAGGRATSWHRALVVGQVALTVPLLLVSALLLETVRASRAFDPGFATEGLVLAEPPLRRLGYDPVLARAYYEQAVERLNARPGTRAALGMVVPLGDSQESLGMDVGEGKPTSVDFNVVGPGYFAMMGIPLRAGREFSPADITEGASPAMVVNETFVRRYCPDGRAVGRRFLLGGQAAEVVGVAADIKYYFLGEPPRPYVYASTGVPKGVGMTVHVRTADGEAGAAAVGRELAVIDPRVPIRAHTFRRLRDTALAPPRLMGLAAGAAGALGLALAVGGLFGLTAYLVGQRTREIAVRMALGAGPMAVRWMVIRQGLALTTLGLVLGALPAAAAAGAVRGLLFGVSPADPVALATVAGLLLVAAALACAVPARRATSVDPIEALRHS